MSLKRLLRYPPFWFGVVAAFLVTAVTASAIFSAEAGPEPTLHEPPVLAAEPLPLLLPETEDKTVVEEPIPETEPITDPTEPDAEAKAMLLRIAMAEAEGEGITGKALVMRVVLNRVSSGDFPDTVEGVIFQPRQFPPTLVGGRYHTTEPDAECYEALALVEEGWDESKGALYFDSTTDGSWHSRNLEYLYQFGGHRFYK